MALAQKNRAEVAFSVNVPSVSRELARSCIATHLNLSLAAAQGVLDGGQLLLTEAEEKPLVTLLRSLGAQIAPAGAPLFAMNFRVSRRVARTAADLAQLLQRDRADVLAELAQPWGFILQNLSQAETERLKQAFARRQGVRMLTSHQRTAVVDVFARHPMDPAASRRLAVLMAQKGLSAGFGGALVTGLRPETAANMAKTFDSAGLLPLDRVFQRFDLYLTAVGRNTDKEVMAFLALRGDLPCRVAQSVTAMDPMRLETNLSRGDAMAFCADYAALGCTVKAGLSKASS